MEQVLSSDDIMKIAKLHHNHLNYGFTASLGVEFLHLFYEMIYLSNGSSLFVVKKRDEVIGFVSGGVSLTEIYILLLKHPIRLMITLLPSLFSFSNLTNILYILFRHRSSNSDVFPQTNAELYSLVIEENYWGHGLATQLYLRLSKYFTDKNVHAFSIVVGDTLDGAKCFYEKQGAKPIATLFQGGQKTSTIYLQNIKLNYSCKDVLL